MLLIRTSASPILKEASDCISHYPYRWNENRKGEEKKKRKGRMTIRRNWNLDFYSSLFLAACVSNFRYNVQVRMALTLEGRHETWPLHWRDPVSDNGVHRGPRESLNTGMMGLFWKSAIYVYKIPLMSVYYIFFFFDMKSTYTRDTLYTAKRNHKSIMNSCCRRHQ